MSGKRLFHPDAKKQTNALSARRGSMLGRRGVPSSAKKIQEEQQELLSSTTTTPVNKEDSDKPLRTSSETMAKLKVEAASPYRLLRKFIYAAFVGGGGLGTFTAIPQLILAIQHDGDVMKVVTNLAVDVGAAGLGVFFWIREQAGEKQQLDRFVSKQKKADSKLSKEEIAEREKVLSLLPAEIQVNERNASETRTVSLGDLMDKGKQNIVIVTGELSFVKDSILSARSAGRELFTSEETFILPFPQGQAVSDLDGSSQKGFSAKEGLLDAPYIALPVQTDAWERVLQAEFELAKAQGAKDAQKRGLVIVINKTGKVIRRGLGLPPWKEIIDELKTKAKAKSKK
eukprot:scaffold10372_cov243-Ochromonas_danica.AAC.11